MNLVETALPGVYLIEPRVFQDPRGLFLETYHRAKFQALGLADDFVQDNQSRSFKGVLRGMHFQRRHPQAKLCWAIEGEVLDVAMDVRIGSPTFGKWMSVVLSAEKHNQIYIPAGFAHGFLVLSDWAQFLYKCSDFYDADDEQGILWNDPEPGIHWGITAPLLSEKDQNNPPLSRIPRENLPRYYLP